MRKVALVLAACLAIPSWSGVLGSTRRGSIHAPRSPSRNVITSDNTATDAKAIKIGDVARLAANGDDTGALRGAATGE